MGIETWNSIHKRYNPAWRETESLRLWCERNGLSPNTIKPFSSLTQVVERTALGRVFPLTSIEWNYLTPKERQLTSGNPSKISQMSRLAIIDIDGVLVDIWPTLGQLFRGGKYDLATLRKTIERTKPPWTSLLPLGDIARKVDKLILWTSRLAPEEVPPLFGNLGSFDAFPFLSQSSIHRIEEHFFPEKTQVIAGKIKGLSRSGFDQITRTIEDLRDPYIVYIGSSLFDGKRFWNLINFLRTKEMPFDQLVFCTNCHFIL